MDFSEKPSKTAAGWGRVSIGICQPVTILERDSKKSVRTKTVAARDSKQDQERPRALFLSSLASLTAWFYVLLIGIGSR